MISVEKLTPSYLLIELISTKKKALKLTIPFMIEDLEQEDSIPKLASYVSFVWTSCQISKSNLPK